MPDAGTPLSPQPPDPSGDPVPPVSTLMADQRRRGSRGERLRVESYLERFPTLGNDPEGLLDLIYNEVVLREQRGEAPQLAEYQTRFPDFAASLADLFEIHGAIEQLSIDEGTSFQGGSEEFSRDHSLGSEGGFPSLEGYEIVGVLGSGGMGVVYKARDLRRGVMVAVKTMRQVDAASIARFKQEFRGLLDVSHPNLVNLYELISDGHSWFIVMELILGMNFLEFVRRGSALNREAGDSGSAKIIHWEEASTWSEDGGPPTDPDLGNLESVPTTHKIVPVKAPKSLEIKDDAGPSLLDAGGYSRLREGMKQLAEGLMALHQAGKLHRDIKPSNVMVTRQGRVVLMDFGLIASPGEGKRDISTEGNVVGTAAYMAPEQASGKRLSPATDWYSTGVMLFEALTGRRPFLGPSLEVLMDKQRIEPPPPREFADQIPADLNALCVDLLRRDPVDRPAGPEVLARLGTGEAESSHATVSVAAAPSNESLFVGRESHRKALASALDFMSQGRAVVVFVQGQSGVGKSALVGKFLDELSERDEAVILAGRCYERESVPYKALDSLIDSLSRYLRRLPSHEVEALLPRDVGPLTRVFPVLGRVGAAAMAPRRASQIPDPQELRRRAYAALRELLGRLGDRHPLVLAIDDLQWGDPDSLTVLTEILRPPDPPVLLFLACFRSEELHESPFLRAMREGPITKTLECRDLIVGPLTEEEARTLARQLVEATGTDLDQRAETIARESAGNPLFVAELARSTQESERLSASNGGAAKPLALDDVLWSRVLRLPNVARELLMVVAVSGGTVRADVAWQCLNQAGDERASLSLLRTGRLIRVTGRSSSADQLEAYHDRVREAVVAHLSPSEKMSCHRRLAGALEAAGEGDHEVLGVHCREAGELGRAAVHFRRAADQAVEALAFERAAKLYRQALEFEPANEGKIQRLRALLAESLANAGRGADAACEYLAACEGAPVGDALELRRRAAMQLLISGHIDQGLETLRDVLAAIGMSLPRTPRQAMASLLWHRAKLSLRGLGFRPRDTTEVAPADLTRVDVCWSAAIGLSNVDWIRGADFHARSLLLTLSAGEPSRVGRAVALEAAQTATAGLPAARKTARLLKRASDLAKETGQAYTLGMVTLAEGVSSYLECRWSEALEATDRAESFFREHCTGVAWELDTAHAYALWALSHLGQWKELARRYPLLIDEAKERGDLYAAMNLSTYVYSIVMMASDQPLAAGLETQRLLSQWSREGYHVQHNDLVWASVQIDLYHGVGPTAWKRISGHWPTLARSMLLRVQFIRVAMLGLRARCALAAVCDQASLLQSAERDATRLSREKLPWADAQSLLIRAASAFLRGRDHEAVERLRQASAQFRDCRMELCGAVADRRLGEILGGDEGSSLIKTADAGMFAQGIQRPDRVADLFAPGFTRR